MQSQCHHRRQGLDQQDAALDGQTAPHAGHRHARQAEHGERRAHHGIRMGEAHHQRSDVCAVPAAGVIAEAMVALVLANAVLEKFGGDSVVETKRNLDGYLAAIPANLATAAESDLLLGS